MWNKTIHNEHRNKCKNFTGEDGFERLFKGQHTKIHTHTHTHLLGELLFIQLIPQVFPVVAQQ